MVTQFQKYYSEVDIMPKCLGCGRSYKTHSYDNRKYVNSCSHCTMLFSDKTVSKIIDDFFK